MSAGTRGRSLLVAWTRGFFLVGRPPLSLLINKSYLTLGWPGHTRLRAAQNAQGNKLLPCLTVAVFPFSLAGAKRLCAYGGGEEYQLHCLGSHLSNRIHETPPQTSTGGQDLVSGRDNRSRRLALKALRAAVRSGSGKPWVGSARPVVAALRMRSVPMAKGAVPNDDSYFTYC